LLPSTRLALAGLFFAKKTHAVKTHQFRKSINIWPNIAERFIANKCCKEVLMLFVGDKTNHR
jgi:hypothetical protein